MMQMTLYTEELLIKLFGHFGITNIDEHLNSLVSFEEVEQHRDGFCKQKWYYAPSAWDHVEAQRAQED